MGRWMPGTKHGQYGAIICMMPELELAAGCMVTFPSWSLLPAGGSSWFPVVGLAMAGEDPSLTIPHTFPSDLGAIVLSGRRSGEKGLCYYVIEWQYYLSHYN
ncbi:hypothetical protein CAPTEDRAFT_202222 [Capitella teleta]|uniref:Uncharacterized protein n=1 Tax=Capitella teleta TaxID=283909 RepID=R7V8P1_CAPTE|nr:hypothetical protein CAPTEDRAFT_202222 [Capitella teleta]|eukprot:ELU12120.1 hypothetical protein CAPTEDRAFT_202222 [Capitella teleta]